MNFQKLWVCVEADRSVAPHGAYLTESVLKVIAERGGGLAWAGCAPGRRLIVQNRGLDFKL